MSALILCLLFSLLTQCFHSSSSSYSPNQLHLIPSQQLIHLNATDTITIPSLSIKMTGPNVVRAHEGISYLEFSRGDDFRVVYSNLLVEEGNGTSAPKTGAHENSSTGRPHPGLGPTLIHAHGIIHIPHNLDGVPFISSLPLQPHDQTYYQYKLHNAGSHWLHSHYAFQLGLGLAAPLIVKEADGDERPHELDSVHQEVVMWITERCPIYTAELERHHAAQHSNKRLSGAELHKRVFSDSPPDYCEDHDQILNKLRKKFEKDREDGGFPQCYEAKNLATNGKRKYYRTNIPHIYDVWHKYRLVNGRTVHNAMKVKVDAGKRVRLRIINASAFSTYRIYIPKKLNPILVASDGYFVEPIYKKDSFWIGAAQRYDVLVDIPKEEHDLHGYPIRAVIEDTERTVQSALVLHAFHPSSQILSPPDISPEAPGFYSQEEEFMYHAWNPMDVSRPVTKFLDVKRLTHGLQTREKSIPHNRMHHEVDIQITGDNGFDSINNHSYLLPPFSEYTRNEYPIRVTHGDRVLVRFKNNNVDSHPLHLHGTHFQVVAINDIPVRGAVRDTVMIDKDCNSVSILFDADAYAGVWLFHCHIEMHQNAGQQMTVEYQIAKEDD